MSADLEKGRMVLRQVFHDPTPHGIVQNCVTRKSLEFTQIGEFTEEEALDVIEFSRRLALKLVSVWQHLDRYQSEEAGLIAKGEKDPIDSNSREPVRIANSQELYLEFDEFLVQVKSTLDYLVKAPALVLGANRWSLHSFGDKGMRVIKTLRGSTPSEFKPYSTMLQTFIRDAKPAWLDLTVDLRDRVNHYQRGGIDPDLFTVVVVQDGDEVQVNRPMWSDDEPIGDSMDIVWDQLIQFVERFYFAALSYRLPDSFRPAFLSRANVEPGESQVRIMPQGKAEEIFGRGEEVKVDD